MPTFRWDASHLTKFLGACTFMHICIEYFAKKEDLPALLPLLPWTWLGVNPHCIRYPSALYGEPE